MQHGVACRGAERRLGNRVQKAALGQPAPGSAICDGSAIASSSLASRE
jgi:hypothetical protein